MKNIKINLFYDKDKQLFVVEVIYSKQNKIIQYFDDELLAKKYYDEQNWSLNKC